jgi:hypothetical protein
MAKEVEGLVATFPLGSTAARKEATWKAKASAWSGRVS